MGITQDKAALRRVLRGQTLPPHRRQQASAAICASLLALPELANAPVVFAFVPTPRAPDITPALRSLLANGHTLALPRCTAPGIMEARQVDSLDNLSPGSYGIPEPGPDRPLIPWGMLSAAIIPCVAADRAGGRLGHGGGYYDRFLSWAPPDMAALMVCYAHQLVEQVPAEPHDIPVPLVITQEGVWRDGKPEGRQHRWTPAE